MHKSQSVHSRSNSHMRTRYKDCSKARGEHKNARDCWRNSRALCEKFYAHTSEARGATDLSLATPLATLLKTVFVPFFLTRNAFIKTWNRCIFLHPNQTGDFSGACFSFTSALGASQMSVEKVHQPNELRQNNDMLLGYMSVKQTARMHFINPLTVKTFVIL